MYSEKVKKTKREPQMKHPLMKRVNLLKLNLRNQKRSCQRVSSLRRS